VVGCWYVLDHFFFFFFQAEDGIRDLYVTGVQTCALPISRRSMKTFACGAATSAISREALPLSGRSMIRNSSEAAPQTVATLAREIGRASCREREKISRGDGDTTKKNETRQARHNMSNNEK